MTDFACLFDLQIPIKFRLQDPQPQDVKMLMEHVADLDRRPSMRNGEFLVNNQLTIADISLIVSIAFLECLDISIEEHVHLAKWAAKMKSQPFYIQCQDGWEAWKARTKTEEWRQLIESKKNEGLN